MSGIRFMMFRLFLTDVALQGHPEMLDQPVNVTSRIECSARCLSINLCQAFFFRKYVSGTKHLCTPAYRRFVRELGYTFLASRGQDLYHVDADKCVPQKDLYWYPYIQFCFMFSSEQMSYSLAKQACEVKGYRLAVLKTDLKYSLTRVRILRSSDLNNALAYYIGAVRVPNQFRWTWLDGSEVTNPDWCPGDPSNIAENCFDLISSQFRMNDENCQISRRFICELVSP